MKDRKLQIAGGNYLDFDQLARMLNSLSTLKENKPSLITDDTLASTDHTNNSNVSSKKAQALTFSDLEEDTGLPFRQLRNRAAVARALGLFQERSLKLTIFGEFIAEYDIFFENIGTLEYCHYLAAGRERNLVWFDVFNELLPNNPSADYSGWMNFFKSKYKDEYTEHSLKDHFPKEIRFMIEAYVKNRFRKLELIIESSEGKLQRRRYANPQPLILAAMIYDYVEHNGSSVIQIEELSEAPGSPGAVFAMETSTMRSNLESLHEQNLLRMESRHGLDQIRIKDGLTSEDFLKAYYTGFKVQSSEVQGGMVEGNLL